MIVAIWYSKLLWAPVVCWIQTSLYPIKEAIWLFCNTHLSRNFWLVTIYHESSFHTNEGQTWQWAGGEKQILYPKSQSRGHMISDLLKKQHGGYAVGSWGIWVTEPSCLCLDCGQPEHSFWSKFRALHLYTEDVLIASRMNVSDGGTSHSWDNTEKINQWLLTNDLN